jgi:hypothetical protein
MHQLLNSYIKNPIAIIISIYLIAVLWINPSGEFTLNDDWSYCKAVDDYTHNSKIDFSKYIAVPFILQFYIGLLFTKIGGFSFFILRIPSIISLIISLFFIDKTLKILQTEFYVRLLLLGLICFNPLVFSLSMTFMPEMFSLLFLSASIWAMFNLKNRYSFNLYYLLFLFSCICLTFIRQTGLLIPLSFALIGIVLSSKKLKTISWYLFPFLISYLALKIYEYIMLQNHILPSNFNLQLSKIILYLKGKPTNSISVISMYILTSFTTIGCFILPITITHVKPILNSIKNNKLYTLVFFILFIALFFKTFFTAWYMPFVGNMFWSKGVGPVIIDGFNSDKWIFVEGQSRYIYISLSFIGGISFFFYLIQQIELIKIDPKSTINQFRLIALLIISGYVFLISLNYANDRYMLFLLPVILISHSYQSKIKNRLNISFTILILMVLFSLATTKDYFSFHKARGIAIKHLIKELKIDPIKIDGGFEFNGYYTSEMTKYNNNHSCNWWWVVNNDYVISVRNKKTGYSIESQYPVHSYISYPFKSIYILKKDRKTI